MPVGIGRLDRDEPDFGVLGGGPADRRGGGNGSAVGDRYGPRGRRGAEEPASGSNAAATDCCPRVAKDSVALVLAFTAPDTRPITSPGISRICPSSSAMPSPSSPDVPLPKHSTPEPNVSAQVKYAPVVRATAGPPWFWTASGVSLCPRAADRPARCHSIPSTRSCRPGAAGRPNRPGRHRHGIARARDDDRRGGINSRLICFAKLPVKVVSPAADPLVVAESAGVLGPHRDSPLPARPATFAGVNVPSPTRPRRLEVFTPQQDTSPLRVTAQACPEPTSRSRVPDSSGNLERRPRQLRRGEGAGEQPRGVGAPAEHPPLVGERAGPACHLDHAGQPLHLGRHEGTRGHPVAELTEIVVSPAHHLAGLEKRAAVAPAEAHRDGTRQSGTSLAVGVVILRPERPGPGSAPSVRRR